MKRFLFLVKVCIVCVFCVSCSKQDSFKIVNATQEVIKVSYDDRIYRSDFESKEPVVVDTLIQPGASFFVGIIDGSRNGCSNIWPEVLDINFGRESISLSGRNAICSVFDENGLLEVGFE